MKDIIALSLVLIVSLAAGLVFKFLNIPAPFMLGSLSGCWIAGANFSRLNGRFFVPRWSHKLVVTGLGVTMGSMFGPESIGTIVNWLPTVTAVLVSTLVTSLLGFLYLTKVRKYEPLLSVFCSIPGGQAEVLAISKNYFDKDYIVAIFHLSRVVVIFGFLPFFLGFMLDLDSSGYSANASITGLADFPVSTILIFVAIAVVGFLAASRLRSPVPHLFGPLVLSLLLHVFGFIDLPRVNEFVLIAQLVIGGAIGARLSQVSPLKLIPYIKDSLVVLVMTLSVFVFATFMVLQWVDEHFVDLILAFVPGGIYEISLLSLLFGLETGLIAIHHSLRMLSIVFCLPILIRLLDKKGDR